MNPQTLQAFFDSNPSFQAEYNRVASMGDRRSPLQWLQDHMNSSPGTRDEFNAFAAQAGNASTEAAFANYPQLAAAYAAAKQSNPGLSPSDFAVSWANANPNNPLLNDPAFLSSVGLESDNGPSMPLEQALLQYTTDQGRADINADAGRQAEAQAILARYAPAFDQARNTIAGIYDGSLLTSEYGASDEARAAQQAALEQQLNTRTGALNTAISGLYAAQDPLNQARLDAANTAATGVNLGVQNERDRLMAQFAQDGYVGSSTGTDAALARASIAGRQQAADMLGQAKVANATDTAGIGRYAATEGRALTDYGAGEQRNIADSAAQRRLGFFSNDIARRLASLALPGQAAQTEFGLHTAADDYGQSGYQRLMKNLQYFRTQGGSAPTAAPYYQNTPPDNAAENLGAGLVGVAGNIGNANNWWTKPSSSSSSPDPFGPI